MTRIRSAVAAVLFACSSAFAADSKLLALLPSDSQVVGGINATSTAISPFGQFVLSQLPANDPGFTKFVMETGFDPRTQLQEIVFGGNPGPGNKHAGLVVARGTFNGPQIVAAGKSAGATSFIHNGVEVLRSKDGDACFAIFDGSVAVAGHEDKVKRAIEQRNTGVSIDPKIAAKVAEVGSRFDAWMVSQAPVGAFAGAAPNAQANNVMKNNALQAIQQTSGGVKFGNIVEFTGEALTASDKDALALADVIRFAAGMMQMHRAKNPEIEKFAALLDSLDVKATASTVHLTMSVPQANLEELVKARKAGARRAALHRTPVQ